MIVSLVVIAFAHPSSLEQLDSFINFFKLKKIILLLLRDDFFLKSFHRTLKMIQSLRHRVHLNAT